MRAIIALPFAAALALLGSSRVALAQPPPFPPPPPPTQSPPPAPYYYAPPQEAPPVYPAIPPRAPRASITPMIGYQLGGAVDTQDGNFNLGNGPTYGVALDLGIIGGTSLELGYRMHDSALDVTPPGSSTYRLYTLSTHYAEIGAKQEFIVSGSIRPYAGITFGGALFAPHAAVDNDLRAFGSILGGVNFYVARDVAVRAQARLSTVFLSSGSSIFCSSYYGCGYGFGGVGLPQFELAVGPAITF